MNLFSKLVISSFVCFLWMMPFGMSHPLLEDSTFDCANELKVELKEIGDSTVHLRIALGEEIRQICETAAATKNHVDFVEVLYACEMLVLDLHDSYEYLAILQRTADNWNQAGVESEGIAEVYMALVRISARMSNHPRAFHYLNKISELPQSSLGPDLKAKFHFFKGYLAYYAENLTEATIHSKKAAAESLHGTEIRVRLLAHDASATCLNETGRHKEAFDYATKAIKFQNAYLDTAKHGRPIGNLYLNLAEAEYGIGHKTDAYEHTELALKLAIESKHPIMLGNSYTVRARFLRQDGQFNKAKVDIYNALEHFNMASDLYSANLARKELILIAKEENDLATAFEISDEYHHLRDSLDARRHYISSRMESLDREAERNLAQQALTNEMIARRAAEKSSARLERFAWCILVSLLISAVVFIYVRLRSRHTTQQLLEKEVERRTAKITEQANRLQASNEELERFAYIASHDLKTPLRNITSFLNLIERRLPSEAKKIVSDYLEIAKTNAQQMHYLISDVLEFSRIDANNNIKSERFSLNLSIHQLINQLEPDLKNINGNIKLTGDVDIIAPKAYVLQVVQNLVENGLKYNNSTSPEVCIEIWQKNTFAHISVTDNGIGIAPEYHEQIFTLFKRLHTSDKYEGTGLGLAVCKKVITRLGGDIKVSQAKNAGTVFELKIPLETIPKDIISIPVESTNRIEAA